MTTIQLEIQQQVTAMLQELARDWDYANAIGPDTRLFADLGFESLDAVVLGTAIQNHYDRAMPFSELLAEIGEAGRDLSIGELVTFVQAQLAAAGETR